MSTKLTHVLVGHPRDNVQACGEHQPSEAAKQMLQMLLALPFDRVKAKDPELLVEVRTQFEDLTDPFDRLHVWVRSYQDQEKLRVGSDMKHMAQFLHEVMGRLILECFPNRGVGA